MALIRMAKTADYVDWGDGKDNAIDQLSQLALFYIAFRSQFDPDGAAADFVAMDAMDRSGDDCLPMFEIESVTHQSGVSVLAKNAAGLTSAAASDLAAITDTATIRQDFQNAAQSQVAENQRWLAQYGDPSTRGQAIANGGYANTYPPPTLQQVTSEMQWLDRTTQAMAGSLAEPDPQFQQWWSQTLSEASSMPFGSDVLPQLARQRTDAQKSIVETAMFAAGVALEKNDQTQFQAITDPLSGQPFTYTQTRSGFQLDSIVKLPNGDSLTLTLPFSTPAPHPN
jgi:hypothetical protein